MDDEAEDHDGCADDEHSMSDGGVDDVTDADVIDKDSN